MRKRLFSLAVVMLALSPAITFGAAGPERTGCWERIREAKASLSGIAGESERKAAVNAIVQAEVARSRHDYKACLDLANSVIQRGERG
ncbi:MAG: hypothetical protein HYZ11_18205 [Candidatus Tectomicrobia bacterium]|uniref:Uncharacterized protein n=1 Tax=Tectimicrobiota bacterium TaxID=2528274 RepID=A0A932I454_UNCTE|nr:hypothetical protein [Candidatus Tectomicrobia bacterium]